MEELTDVEKNSFGKKNLLEVLGGGQRNFFSDSDMDKLCAAFAEELLELLNQCIGRSREKFTGEFAKLKAL